MATIASSVVHRRTSMIQRKNVVKDKEKIEVFMKYANVQDKLLKNNYLIFNDDDNQMKEDTIDNASSINEDENEHFLINFIPYNKRQTNTISKLKISIKTIESFIGLISLLSILGTQFEYEFNYIQFYYPCTPGLILKASYSGDILRMANTILCIILSVLNIIVACLKYQLEREQKIVTKLGFIHSFYSKIMIFDVCLCLIHPIPHVEFCFEINTGIPINYNLMTFLYAINLLKVYFVFRTLLTYSKYTSPLAEKYCNQTGCEAGPVFAGKCLQADAPLLFIAVILCATILLFGLLLRMFELPNADARDYEFFANGFWNVIVTMTTVGYGDFTPKTIPGQIIICISILFGTLLTSLIIVGLTSASSFSPEENRAFLILHRLKLREELMHTCQRIIKLNFYLKQRRSVDPLSDLLMESDYNKAMRSHEELVNTKVRLLRELTQDSFVTQESRLISLEQQIKNSITVILTSLKILYKQKTLLQIQLDEQKKLAIQLVQIGRIVHECIKPLLYNTFRNSTSPPQNNLMMSPENSRNNTLSNYGEEDSVQSVGSKDMKKVKKNEKKLRIKDLSKVLFTQSYTRPITKVKLSSLFLNIITKNIDTYLPKPKITSHDQISYELRKQEIKSLLALENRTLQKICEYTPATVDELYNIMKIYSIDTNNLAKELVSLNDIYNFEQGMNRLRNNPPSPKPYKKKKTIIPSPQVEVSSDSSFDSSEEGSKKNATKNKPRVVKKNNLNGIKGYSKSAIDKEKEKEKEKSRINSKSYCDQNENEEHIIIHTDNNNDIIINNNDLNSFTQNSDYSISPKTSPQNQSPEQKLKISPSRKISTQN